MVALTAARVAILLGLASALAAALEGILARVARAETAGQMALVALITAAALAAERGPTLVAVLDFLDAG